jgi:hypothetical protein
VRPGSVGDLSWSATCRNAAFEQAERVAARHRLTPWRIRGLGLTGIRAHALMWVARGRVHADRAAEVDPLLDEVDRLAPSPLYRSERFHNRATDAWLHGDDERAARELDDCIALLRNLPAAPPAPVWGEWVVLRTVRDATDGTPRAELRGSDVLVQALNRAALAYADAIASADAHRSDAPVLLADGDRLLAPYPFHRYRLRIMFVSCAAGGRLGDAPALLREAQPGCWPITSSAWPSSAQPTFVASASRFPAPAGTPRPCLRGCGCSA